MTSYGKLGVKVWICRGEVLPGQMVQEPEKPKVSPNARPNKRRNNFNNNRRPAANAAPAAEVKEGAE